MSAPNSPCYGCSLHALGCKADCERWAIYQRELKEWKTVVQTEKKKYWSMIDAEIQRKSAEKKRKGKK